MATSDCPALQIQVAGRVVLQMGQAAPADQAFFGTSENAVKAQIWSAVCVYMPVDLAHEFEIGSRRRARQVIHRAARKTRRLGLFRDA